ncbi:hypothetical protein FF1_035697 [Malus domestica]
MRFRDQSSSSPYETPSSTPTLGMPSSTFQQQQLQTLLFNLQQLYSPSALEPEGPFYMPSFEEPTPFPDVNLMNKIDPVDLIHFSLPSRDSQTQEKDL